MVQFTPATPDTVRERYWKEWLDNNSALDEEDILGKQVFKVVEEAYKYKQYSYNENEFEDSTRLLRVRIDLSQNEIRSMFGLEPLTVYGEGIYLPLEGLTLTPSTRESINYDRAVATVASKGQYLHLEGIPQDVVESHKWGFTIPALEGVFVPKKCRLLEWVYSVKALQYFDLQLN